MSKKAASGRGAAAAMAVAAAAALAACRTPASDGPGATQGWSDPARAAWYNADQGSRLMPLLWFQALEQPSATGKFLDAAYLANFRILPPWPGQTLPIGFAVDRIDDDTRLAKTSLHWRGTPAAGDKVDWVGLNCAACHTGQMSYGGKAITVDGAPSLFDFQSFIEAVDAALTQTRDAAQPGAADAGRWDRFASAVLAAPGGGGDTPDNRKRLLGELEKLIAWETATEALNKTSSRYGYGRVDAVGHIYNRILLFGGAPQPTPNPADAPVSYPHLWNITKQSQLQWDGIAQNSKINIGVTPTDFGALGRNTGEVLGVFGEVVIRKPSGPGDLAGFVSSARVNTLNEL
ncbi:MAG TPA: di-heme-cytochrome C peroxidase, partial [Phenylobacterium sp.]|nr:di-heme-cytochrome C peroxidase [Phenylobacterium sp.]